MEQDVYYVVFKNCEIIFISIDERSALSRFNSMNGEELCKVSSLKQLSTLLQLKISQHSLFHDNDDFEIEIETLSVPEPSQAIKDACSKLDKMDIPEQQPQPKEKGLIAEAKFAGLRGLRAINEQLKSFSISLEKKLKERE